MTSLRRTEYGALQHSNVDHDSHPHLPIRTLKVSCSSSFPQRIAIWLEGLTCRLSQAVPQLSQPFTFWLCQPPDMSSLHTSCQQLGISLERAEADLSAISHRLTQEFQERYEGQGVR